VDSLAGRYIGLDTVSPLGITTNDPCVETAQGKGWLYFIDGLTGGGPNEAILDTDGDGLINASDALYNGITTTADGRNLSSQIDSKSDASRTTYAVQSGGRADALPIQFNCRVLGNCQKTIRTREWRQIFMR
jgi:hypothetical protein